MFFIEKFDFSLKIWIFHEKIGLFVKNWIFLKNLDFHLWIGVVVGLGWVG